MTDLDQMPAPAPTSAPPAPMPAPPAPPTAPASADAEHTVPVWLVVLLFLATLAGCVLVAMLPRGG